LKIKKHLTSNNNNININNNQTKYTHPKKKKKKKLKKTKQKIPTQKKKKKKVFEGHTHYIMQVVFNPKDTNTFASASLDRTIKVWSLGSPVANYTLEGHEKGVNCVEYYQGSEKPYLVSGADDQ